MSEQNEKQQINENKELNKLYDCRVTIRSKLKMIPKIKERISSSKKRLDIFKNTVFGKWLDLDDTNYDNHLLNYVLHHQRPGLSKSVDSDILFDIAGHTLLLGRAEFCLVTGFTCGKVVFPKYLDGGIPPFVRRLFSNKLKKLEKNKDGELVQDKAEKGEAAQPSVTIKDLGELVQKDAKWKKLSADDFVRVCLLYMSELIFRGPEDKKVVPTFMLRLVDDLAAWNDFPWGEYYWEEFHNKVVNLIDIRRKNHIECKKYNPDKLPTYTIHEFAWAFKAKMGHKWYRRSYDYLDGQEKSVPLDDLGGVSQDDESDAYTRQDGHGATVGAKVSGKAMNDADMSAIVHVEETKSAREIVLENKVESLEAKVEKLQLDHDKMAVFFENFKKIWPELVPPTPDAKEDPSDAAIDGEHLDAVGHPDENKGPNEKEDPSDAAIDGEHMDAVSHPNENEGPNAKEDPSDTTINGEHMDIIGSPDETEEPNAQEPISHVLNTPVDNSDVLMTYAPNTINLADPPSHKSEITSPCSSEKKGDGLDGAKTNQEDVPASQNTVKAEVSSAQNSLNPSLDFIIDKYQKKKVVRKPKRATSTAYIRHSKRHKQGMLSMADNGKVVNEPQLPDSHKRNKKKGTLLQDFLPVIGKDRKEMKLEPWTE
ncbi:phospholipase-like protein, partial [Tanacetum coccineum]